MLWLHNCTSQVPTVITTQILIDIMIDPISDYIEVGNCGSWIECEEYGAALFTVSVSWAIVVQLGSVVQLAAVVGSSVSVVGFKAETASLSSACCCCWCCCSVMSYLVTAVLSTGQEMSEKFLKPTCNISATLKTFRKNAAFFPGITSVVFEQFIEYSGN